MCLAARPPAMPAPPSMPQMPAPLPPPPAPPAPPPAPPAPMQVEGAGQKVATIQSKATTKSAAKRSSGATAFAAPTRQVQTIQGSSTGLNIPQ